MIRAMSRRVERNASRLLRRKTLTSTRSTGTTERDTRARRQLIQSITAMIPVRVTRSASMVTTPLANISVMFSMSLVIRVITRPSGTRSK